jgi:putative chitinase
MILTRDQLTAIIGNTSVVDKVFDPLLQTLDKYEISSRLRICHFLAQVIHESSCFYYTTEIASGKDYEGRIDLGNTEPGDGVKFKGRGILQITGRTNYTAISNDFNVPFVDDPELLAQYPYCVLSAGWFWDKHNLNRYADQDNITLITRKINGGLNGIMDRERWLGKCKWVIEDN